MTQDFRMHLNTKCEHIIWMVSAVNRDWLVVWGNQNDNKIISGYNNSKDVSQNVIYNPIIRVRNGF